MSLALPCVVRGNGDGMLRLAFDLDEATTTRLRTVVGRLAQDRAA
jgi:hypothetical protein